MALHFGDGRSVGPMAIDGGAEIGFHARVAPWACDSTGVENLSARVK
jgi:hypothetical protein